MFEAIGTLHSYTKQYQLKKSAKQKVTTGEAFDWKDTRSSFVKAQEPRRTASKSFVELSLEQSKKDDDRTAATKKSGIKPVVSNVAFGGGIRAVIRSRNILIDNSFDTLMAEAKENFIFDGGNLNG